MYGDPAATGKPAGDDLVEGKRTVLVALALDGASAADAARLDAALGTPLSDDRSPSCGASSTTPAPTPTSNRSSSELVTLSLAKLDASSVAEPARQVLRELAAAAPTASSETSAGSRRRD